MEIKRRLIISNTAIVILPFVITIAASFIYIVISSQIFNADISFDNLKKLTALNYEIFKESGSLTKGEAEKFTEPEFQQYIASRLESINAYIVVMKKNNIIFSTKGISKIDIEKLLDADRSLSLKNTVKIGTTSYIVKTHPLDFKDGSTGWSILFAPVDKEDFTSQGFIIFSLSVFLTSFIIANILLTMALARSISKPVARLKAAAGEISRGNLEHNIVEEGDYEIRELCRSFEAMRLKLKESVYNQMKLDDNRKMLVTSISHDLKTPITAIKGYVEGIIDGVASTPEKNEKYLKTIYLKAIQVDEIIDDLLLYSKLDLNQIPFNYENTDMVRFFEDCAAEYQPELEKAKLEIVFDSQIKDKVFAVIDRARFRRVIVNIIDNAKKYMDKENGRIILTLRETMSGIVVSISDNGAGINEKDLPYIFERFYRADAARSSSKGSGLGLAICKQIVEGHGGKIWAVSKENQGTSIMISLKKTL